MVPRPVHMRLVKISNLQENQDCYKRLMSTKTPNHLDDEPRGLQRKEAEEEVEAEVEG